MGISKIEGALLPATRLHANSHALTCRLGQADSSPLLMMQNMPFAEHNSQGLISLSYTADPASFNKQFSYQLGYLYDEKMSGQPPLHHYDSLFDHCYVDLSAAFFVPSLSFLEMACRPENF